MADETRERLARIKAAVIDEHAAVAREYAVAALMHAPASGESVSVAVLPGAEERCAACGGTFGLLEARLWFGPVLHWVIPQRLGPIHSRCQRWNPAQEDALAKVLGPRPTPTEETSPDA